MSLKRPRLDDPPEEEILRLVAQREQFRQARRFQESDAIREELRTMGIELYDKEKEWRSQDGRRGALFTAGPLACTLPEEHIQARIFQREEARKGKDWSMADNIRDELRNSGVELDDRESMWRTSNGRSGFYSGVKAEVTASIGIPAIEKLVAERERLRAGSDFEAADELRRQLAQMGVELFDNERIWKTADGHRGVIITGGHEVQCMLNEVQIAGRVLQREEARNGKDFATADMIRDELRRQGVELLDAQKTWCTADGRQGNYSGGYSVPQPGYAAQSSRGAIGAGNAALASMSSSRMTSSPLTNNPAAGTLSTASIVALVSGREYVREAKDWRSADEIRNDLRAHGVDVWDKDKLWRANDGRQGPIIRQ